MDSFLHLRKNVMIEIKRMVMAALPVAKLSQATFVSPLLKTRMVLAFVWKRAFVGGIYTPQGANTDPTRSVMMEISKKMMDALLYVQWTKVGFAKEVIVLNLTHALRYVETALIMGRKSAMMVIWLMGMGALPIAEWNQDGVASLVHLPYLIFVSPCVVSTTHLILACLGALTLNQQDAMKSVKFKEDGNVFKEIL